MDHHDIIMPIRLQSERARKLLKVFYDCTDAAGQKVGYYHGTYESLKTKRELHSKSGRVWSKEEVSRERRRLVKLGLIKLFYYDDFGQPVDCTTAETRKDGHLVAERRVTITPAGIATLVRYYPKSVAANEAKSPKTWWYPGGGEGQGTDQALTQEIIQVIPQGTDQETPIKGTEEQVQKQGTGSAEWEKIKVELSREVSPAFFQKFLDPLEASVCGNEIRLTAPSPKHQKHVQQRYLPLIRDIASSLQLQPVVAL